MLETIDYTGLIVAGISGLLGGCTYVYLKVRGLKHELWLEKQAHLNTSATSNARHEKLVALQEGIVEEKTEPLKEFSVWVANDKDEIVEHRVEAQKFEWDTEDDILEFYTYGVLTDILSDDIRHVKQIRIIDEEELDERDEQE